MGVVVCGFGLDTIIRECPRSIQCCPSPHGLRTPFSGCTIQRVALESLHLKVEAQVAKATSDGKINDKDVLAQLDKILEAELSGVVRYLHYSFMIFGPNRIPITKWFRDQANEGFNHATIVGEKITALGGHPTVKVKPVPETGNHNVVDILKESLVFEQESLRLYYELLANVEGNVPLEEMVRGLITAETEHVEEVMKMTRTVK